MPAPIMPAPKIPTVLTRWSGTSFGRTAPFSRAPLLMNRLLIMADEDGFITIFVNQRASIRSAVSKGTNEPSYIALIIAFAAG